ARARNRCEYCCISQLGQNATFHMDHVFPSSAGGATTLDILAMACPACSLGKGSRQTATDPQTGQQVRLFSPRRDSWRVHFRWNGVELVGISPTGRATIAALGINRPAFQHVRSQEVTRGRHPPPEHL